mgnify:CR=1 FL=1
MLADRPYGSSRPGSGRGWNYDAPLRHVPGGVIFGFSLAIANRVVFFYFFLFSNFTFQCWLLMFLLLVFSFVCLVSDYLAFTAIFFIEISFVSRLTPHPPVARGNQWRCSSPRRRHFCDPVHWRHYGARGDFEFNYFIFFVISSYSPPPPLILGLFLFCFFVSYSFLPDELGTCPRSLPSPPWPSHALAWQEKSVCPGYQVELFPVIFIPSQQFLNW